jgi:hypothetical protein
VPREGGPSAGPLGQGKLLVASELEPTFLSRVAVCGRRGDDTSVARGGDDEDDPAMLLMVKTHLTFRLDSQAYKSLMPFFTYGRSQGLSIHEARGLLALNQALI